MEPSQQQAVRSDQNGWGTRLCAERFVQRGLMGRLPRPIILKSFLMLSRNNKPSGGLPWTTLERTSGLHR